MAFLSIANGASARLVMLGNFRGRRGQNDLAAA